jgi:hypothetical protein
MDGDSSSHIGEKNPMDLNTSNGMYKEGIH